MTSPTKANRILLVAMLMTTQTIGWGTTFSQVGILASPIVDDLGISRGQVFLGATILYIFAALSAPAAGKLADRFGGLLLLIPGSLVLAAALWALSSADGLTGYLWPWALTGAVYHIGLVTSAYTGLAQALGRNATWAIGTLTIATGLCSTIFWPVSEWLLQHRDWRGVLQIYAALTLGLCLPIHLFLWLKFGALRAGANAGASAAADGPKPALPHVREGRETPAQRTMVAVACVGSLLGVGFGVTAIEIFTALGTPRLDAVLAGSLMGFAYVVSRGIAMVADKWISPTRLAQITYLALPLSLSPLLYYAMLGEPLPAAAAAHVAFAFGLPAGLVGLLRSLMPLHLFGSEAYGARLGVQARATEFSSAIAPFGFTWALGLSATGLLSGLVLMGGAAFWGATRLKRMDGPERRPENA